MDVVRLSWIPDVFEANSRYQLIKEFGVSGKGIKVVINILNLNTWALTIAFN